MFVISVNSPEERGFLGSSGRLDPNPAASWSSRAVARRRNMGDISAAMERWDGVSPLEPDFCSLGLILTMASGFLGPADGGMTPVDKDTNDDKDSNAERSSGTGSFRLPAEQARCACADPDEKPSLRVRTAGDTDSVDSTG